MVFKFISYYTIHFIIVLNIYFKINELIYTNKEYIMLTRNFNMGTITDKTSDIVSFSNSTLDSAKDLFKKKYNLGGILPSPDSPEVKKALSAFCDSKRINGNSGDYLGSLDRELNRNGRLSLCSDSKKMLGSGDTILSMVSKLRSGATFKPDEIASNFIGSEL